MANENVSVAKPPFAQSAEHFQNLCIYLPQFGYWIPHLKGRICMAYRGNVDELIY